VPSHPVSYFGGSLLVSKTGQGHLIHRRFLQTLLMILEEGLNASIPQFQNP